MRVWKAGEAVRITCMGRTVPGALAMASPNGKSLVVEFEAILGGWVGMTALSWDDATETFRDLRSVPMELEEAD